NPARYRISRNCGPPRQTLCCKGARVLITRRAPIVDSMDRLPDCRCGGDAAARAALGHRHLSREPWRNNEQKHGGRLMKMAKEGSKRNRRAFLKAGAAVGGAALAMPWVRNAAAAETTVWKIQTSWPAGVGLETFKKWASSIKE